MSKNSLENSPLPDVKDYYYFPFIKQVTPLYHNCILTQASCLSEDLNSALPSSSSKQTQNHTCFPFDSNRPFLGLLSCALEARHYLLKEITIKTHTHTNKISWLYFPLSLNALGYTILIDQENPLKLEQAAKEEEQHIRIVLL